MSSFQLLIELGGWFLFVIWAVMAGIPSLWFIGRSLKRMSDRVPEPDSWPTVSVVVPARDEGHKIEAGLKSLLASDYPNLEVIALDDRSRDETGAIMDRLAENPLQDEVRTPPSLPRWSWASALRAVLFGTKQEQDVVQKPANHRDKLGGVSASTADVRLHVIHITELPDGWLGKNHALQVGQQRSTGEWILFTDGDVVYQPDTISRSVRYAVAARLDHLPMYPSIESEGIFEAAFVAAFGVIFAAGTQPWLVPTRWMRAYAGVGAFNLVRRSALERANGFEPIRLDILDDVKLGKMLKQTGSKAEVLRSGDAIRIRWQQSAWACITGLEKNAFASANYSIRELLIICGVTCAVFCGPLAGTLFAGNARTGYVAAAVLSHLLFGFSAQLFGHSFFLFPMLVPAGLAFVFAFLRSGWITLRQGGVRWRDTFYPLELLRRNIYQ